MRGYTITKEWEYQFPYRVYPASEWRRWVDQGNKLTSCLANFYTFDEAREYVSEQSSTNH